MIDMLKVILNAPHPISPFNEPARDLRIHNVPLWLHQRNILAPYTTHELELKPGQRFPLQHEETLVYRDNLFFDEEYFRLFMSIARKKKKPCRAAFSADDPAFREHALPLSNSYTPAGGLYLADLWYYPNGPVADVEPLVIDLEATEIGYYHVPTYMADQSGDLVFQVPLKALIAIDSWVHIFIADIVFGLFSRGARFEKRLNEDLGFKLGVLGKAIYEGRQVLECSDLVQVGKNCTIDPHAIIHGPTTIGDNVTINAGAVIENCIIGNNVNISQDVQLMVSVVGDGTFLPFRAALFRHDGDGQQHDRAKYLPANVCGGQEHVHRCGVDVHRLQPGPGSTACHGWERQAEFCQPTGDGQRGGTQLPPGVWVDRLSRPDH